MTLAIGIVGGDGIAVAADSRTSVTLRDSPESRPRERVLSDYTHKVFKVGNVAVTTYGYAFLLGRNIAGHMSEFARTCAGTDEPGPSAKVVAEALAPFMGERFDQHQATVKEAPLGPGEAGLGFLVAGYDDGAGCLHEVTFPGGAVTPIASTNGGGGAAWRGQTDVVARLVKGCDIDLLVNKATEAGLEQQVQALAPTVHSMEYSIPFGFLNLQDSVDLATLLIRTTIDVQRLTHGTLGKPGSWPGVGGPIEVATVTATQGFTWIQQTQLKAERTSGVAVRL